MEEREQLIAQNSDAAVLNTQMDEQLAALVAAQEAERPERQRLEANKKELTVKIQQLNERQLHLQQEARTKRDALTETQHTADQEEFEIKNLRTACRTLETQIVQSPEILKQEIATLGTKLEQERENVVVLEKRGRELVVQADRMGATKTDIVKARKQLDEVEKELARFTTANEDCDRTKDAVIHESGLLKESKAKEQQLKRQIEMISEKIERLTRQQDMKRKTAHANIEQARKDKAALKKEGGSLTNARESKEARATFKAKVTERQELHQRQITAIQEQHARLIDKVFSCDDGLKAKMVAAC